jgi:peptidoglycan hydrolase-like protein with peptidoglycan-binding domain
MSFIKRGSVNKWVEYLQISLVSLGYSVGSCGIDGNFGKGTEEAVYKFQNDNGLQKDGKVGNDTWNAIKGHIKPIQERLIQKGYNVGGCGADGIYGNSTKEAVKNFQRDNGLSVDGIAGPDTQNLLFSYQSIKNMFNPVLNPALLKFMGDYYQKKKEEERENEMIKNLTNFVIQKINNEKEEFFEICNKIKSNVFDFLKIEANITSYDLNYTCKVGFLRVTLNAKSGGEFKYEGDKYIFKNSSLSKTEGFLLNTLDCIADKIGMVFVPQIKTNIETFKQKVGEAIINGSVTIKFVFPKLIYEFEVAKKDDLAKLYGTLTITIEFDFDLYKIAEKVAVEVSKTFGIVKGLIINNVQIIAIIIIVIGVIVVTQNPPAVLAILSAFM